ncbi:uncharacterized protein SCHCODRAFT_02496953 [Schizophyllum commune H4-8]|uniref:uncharacterized protein n=1 Tax=Schizophyllum commune (strain H4-8 / FGSC 9210) TaxID=578458 RepID=UPI002160C514|nr:uncharacterized protein SCHCODRAFT_02496953 [Schizophyllum commune H4-8]KAI5895709.1 hypothetical protein SCHCODRAFT_02496953 [Schizophyllum commune H4-8]
MAMILVPRWALFYVLPVFCCYRAGICTVYCTCIPVEHSLYLVVVVVLCTACEAARIERVLFIRRVSGPGEGYRCVVMHQGRWCGGEVSWDAQMEIGSPAPHFRAQSPARGTYIKFAGRRIVGLSSRFPSLCFALVAVAARLRCFLVFLRASRIEQQCLPASLTSRNCPRAPEHSLTRRSRPRRPWTYTLHPPHAPLPPAPAATVVADGHSPTALPHPSPVRTTAYPAPLLREGRGRRALVGRMMRPRAPRT